MRGGLPSGHAALAFAGWMAATYIVGDSHRFIVSALTFIMALLVAQTRVESGVHSALEVAYGGIKAVKGIDLDVRPWLARHGWDTTAFDISPAAVAAVRDRYPDSPVDYREGDLLDLTGDSADLRGTFDLVVEI